MTESISHGVAYQSLHISEGERLGSFKMNFEYAENHYSSSPAMTVATVVFSRRSLAGPREGTKAFCVSILPAVSPEPQRSPWSACAWMQKAASALSVPTWPEASPGLALKDVAGETHTCFQRRGRPRRRKCQDPVQPWAGKPTRGHTVCWISELGVCTEQKSVRHRCIYMLPSPCHLPNCAFSQCLSVSGRDPHFHVLEKLPVSCT